MITKEEMVFVDHVKAVCKKHKFKLQLRNVSYVKVSSNIKCGGFFDHMNKLLVVATKKHSWLELLVHEYAHMTQWIEDCEAWKNASHVTDEVDRWLEGEDFDTKFIHEIVDKVRDLELDNEKRSVELIKKFKLQVDLDRYVRKANGYVYFYTWIKESRRWSKPGNSPYSNETVISTMPNEFQQSYETIPNHIREVFVSEGI